MNKEDDKKIVETTTCNCGKKYKLHDRCNNWVIIDYYKCYKCNNQINCHFCNSKIDFYNWKQ